MITRSATRAGRSFDVTIEHCAACKQTYRLLVETDRHGRLVERVTDPCACGDTPVRAPVEAEPPPLRPAPTPAAPGRRRNGVTLDPELRDLVRELAALSAATGENLDGCRERIRRETGVLLAQCTVRRYMVEAGWQPPTDTRFRSRSTQIIEAKS